MCMNEAAAEKLPEGMPTCLCNQHFNLQPENTWLPEWGYRKSTNEFILRCPNCNYHEGPFTNKNAAIAGWALSNRKGDEHVLKTWARYYTERQTVPDHLEESKNLRQERA